MPVTTFAEQDIKSDKDQEDLTIEKIFDEQAFDSLKNKCGYSHTEAKNMINKPQATHRGTWVIISYRGDPNVILRGQAKLDRHDRVIEVAPRLNVVKRSGGCNVTATRNNRFLRVGYRSVRFELITELLVVLLLVCIISMK